MQLKVRFNQQYRVYFEEESLALAESSKRCRPDHCPIVVGMNRPATYHTT